MATFYKIMGEALIGCMGMDKWTDEQLADLRHSLSLPYAYRCTMDKRGYITKQRSSGITRSGNRHWVSSAGISTPGVKQGAKILRECGWYKKRKNSRWWYHDADYLAQKRNHVASLRESLLRAEIELAEMVTGESMSKHKFRVTDSWVSAVDGITHSDKHKPTNDPVTALNLVLSALNSNRSIDTREFTITLKGEILDDDQT